jgi:hypothetical protein
MTTTWTQELKHPIDYLAQESSTSDLLLTESGDQIILDQTGTSDSLWSNQTKN